MSPLRPCPHCHRHHRPCEPVCPFCGAALPACAPTSETTKRDRMSRDKRMPAAGRRVASEAPTARKVVALSLRSCRRVHPRRTPVPTRAPDGADRWSRSRATPISRCRTGGVGCSKCWRSMSPIIQAPMAGVSDASSSRPRSRTRARSARSGWARRTRQARARDDRRVVARAPRAFAQRQRAFCHRAGARRPRALARRGGSSACAPSSRGSKRARPPSCARSTAASSTTTRCSRCSWPRSRGS